jgi:hypothetical protein
LHRPFVILFEKDGADQASDRLLVGEDADDLGPTLLLAIDPLERIGRVDLGAMILTERLTPLRIKPPGKECERRILLD